MSRRTDLEWLLEIARESINDSEPEKRAPLIGQMRAITSELESLGGAESAEKGGLIDFQEALAKRRQSAATASGGTSRH
jgi:hypothetical protein